MNPVQLRIVRDAVPFRPFTIRVAGGRSYRIPHRDFLSIFPSGRNLIVYEPDDTYTILDTILVSEIFVENVPGASAASTATSSS